MSPSCDELLKSRACRPVSAGTHVKSFTDSFALLSRQGCPGSHAAPSEECFHRHRRLSFHFPPFSYPSMGVPSFCSRCVLLDVLAVTLRDARGVRCSPPNSSDLPRFSPTTDR